MFQYINSMYQQSGQTERVSTSPYLQNGVTVSNNKGYADTVYGGGGVYGSNKNANGLTVGTNYGERGVFGTTPIQLHKAYGGILGGYQPSIIRPFDSVSLPRDIKYGDNCDMGGCGIDGPDRNNNGAFKRDGGGPNGGACAFPCYAGSKAQQWNSEKNAIGYYAMRPLITNEIYNSLLKRMFGIMLNGNNGAVPTIDTAKYTLVFCEASTKRTIMDWLMTKVAIAVRKIPEMAKNSSYKFEEFHYTDVDLYQFVDVGMFYCKVLFNLYNPLRSISTMVAATINIDPTTAISSTDHYTLVDIDFINEVPELKTGKLGMDSGSKIVGSPVSYNSQITVPTERPQPSDVLEWNYMNTLNVQKFNDHGHFQPGHNIEIKAGVSDTLEKQMRIFENNSSEYLMACSTPQFTGMVPIVNPNIRVGVEGPSSLGTSFHQSAPMAISASAQNALDKPRLVYNAPLVYRPDNTIEQQKLYPTGSWN